MQIVFDFSNQKIEVIGEGPELTALFTLVRDIAPKLPSITVTTTGAPSSGGAPLMGNGSAQSGSATPDTQHHHGSQTMRQFVKSLALSSLSERIAAIAFYQAKTLSRPTFSPKDMADWFTQCGLEKPSQMPVAVHSAKVRSGFVENAAHGSWKLATQGENMIIRKIEEALEKKA